MIHIYIGQNPAHSRLPHYDYEGGFDAHLLHQALDEAGQDSESGEPVHVKIRILSPERRFEEETRYNEAKKACAHAQQVHLGLSFTYSMEAYPRKKMESPRPLLKIGR